MFQNKYLFLHQVRSARNDIMHTSDFKLTEGDFKSYSKSMVNILNDVNISTSPRAQHAVAQIQRVCITSDFIISLFVLFCLVLFLFGMSFYIPVNKISFALTFSLVELLLCNEDEVSCSVKIRTCGLVIKSLVLYQLS